MGHAQERQPQVAPAALADPTTSTWSEGRCSWLRQPTLCNWTIAAFSSWASSGMNPGLPAARRQDVGVLGHR
jgi:hypothetical protein